MSRDVGDLGDSLGCVAPSALCGIYFETDVSFARFSGSICNRFGEEAPAVVVPVPSVGNQLQFVFKISDALIRGNHVFNDNYIPGIVFFCISLFDGDRISQFAEVFCKLLSQACLRKNNGEVYIARLSQILTLCRDVTKGIAVFVVWENGQAALAPGRLALRAEHCKQNRSVQAVPFFSTSTPTSGSSFRFSQEGLKPCPTAVSRLRRFGASDGKRPVWSRLISYFFFISVAWALAVDFCFLSLANRNSASLANRGAE